MRFAAFAAVFLILPACSRQPGYYTPQADRPAARALGPGELSHFTAMDGPAAANHLVSGVLQTDGAPWRWCERRAELRFQLPDTRGLRFRTEIAVSEMTFKQTGPVRIDVSINGKPLGAVVYGKPENRTAEFEVPPDMVTAARPVAVTLTADKEWVEPGTGVRRAFILTSAGFVQ